MRLHFLYLHVIGIEQFQLMDSGYDVHPHVCPCLGCSYVHAISRVIFNYGRDFSLVSFFGRPLVKRFALCYPTVVLSVCLSCPVCDVDVLWPNGWMDQDETWHGG